MAHMMTFYAPEMVKKLHAFAEKNNAEIKKRDEMKAAKKKEQRK